MVTRLAAGVSFMLVAAPVFAQTAALPPPGEINQPSIVATRPPGSRVLIVINGGYDVASRGFADTIRASVHAEDASYQSDYRVDAGPTVAARGTVRVWKQLVIGAGFSRYSRATPIEIAASVPHPFVFNRARTFNGTASGTRTETALHVHAGASFDLHRNVVVSAFGGPSFFTVRQHLISRVDHSEEYPYDSAAFRAATTSRAEGSQVGFHVGGDVAYFFSSFVGVGGSISYAAAAVPVERAGDRARLDTGGANAAGGLRLRF